MGRKAFRLPKLAERIRPRLRVTLHTRDRGEWPSLQSREHWYFREICHNEERGRGWRWVLLFAVNLHLREGDVLADGVHAGNIVDASQLAASGRALMERALERLVLQIQAAANIASAGAIDLAEVQFIDDELPFHSTPMSLSGLISAREFRARSNWPELAELPFDEVWHWMSHNKLLVPLGSSPLNRAFNAFTHFFGPPMNVGDSSGELFWSVMALEALYATSTTGVMQQVSERLQLVLGARPGLKKVFNRLYSVRSSFIHGSLPFPAQYDANIGLFETQQFYNQVDEATTVAQLLLLATFQTLIVRRWRGFRFSTMVGNAVHVSA